MNTTSIKSNKTEHSKHPGFFSRGIVIAACILIVIGYFLMAGSGSTEQTFNPDIFSTTRIVIAPILCLSGYLLMIVGILRKR